MQEPSQSQAVESNSAGGTCNSRDESPGIGQTDRWGMYLGARPSFLISNIMRQLAGTTAQPFADQTLERTDELVRNEVRNAEAAQFD